MGRRQQDQAPVHLAQRKSQENRKKREEKYSQLSPWGHLAITHTTIIRTPAKSPAKINYRRLTEINSRCYGLSLQSTLALRTPPYYGQQLTLPAKINYRRLTEINSRNFGLSLLKGKYHGVFDLFC